MSDDKKGAALSEREAFDREVGSRIEDAASRGIAWFAWQAARSDMKAWVELWDAAVEVHNATYAETRFQKRSQFKEVADRAEAAGNRLRAAMEATREARIIAKLAATPKGDRS